MGKMRGTCIVWPCEVRVWRPLLAQSSSCWPGMFQNGIWLTHQALRDHPNLARLYHRRWRCESSALACPWLGHRHGPGTLWDHPLPLLRIDRTALSVVELRPKPFLARFWRDRHFWIPSNLRMLLRTGLPFDPLIPWIYPFIPWKIWHKLQHVSLTWKVQPSADDSPCINVGMDHFLQIQGTTVCGMSISSIKQSIFRVHMCIILTHEVTSI